MHASKEIGNAAGEIAVLFGKRDSDYPEEKLQKEIMEILKRNNIVKNKHLSLLEARKTSLKVPKSSKDVSNLTDKKKYDTIHTKGIKSAK